MKITRGKIASKKKTVLYGPEGIGKSTFAAQFPDPVFIDTEGSTKELDVARMDAPSSWSMLLEEVRYIKQNPNLCKTLVLDTADWAELLCSNHVCSTNQKNSIEEFGYGKGYVYLQEEFGRLLNLLEEVVEAGVHVVLTAHAKMRKFEQPDEMGAYDRWEMKLSKTVAPLVKEWADMLLFCNYKTFVINVDGQGAQKGKNKAQGGKRVMYTSHHNCWDAKNRYGLPEEVPFAYASIASILEETVVATSQETPSLEQTATGSQTVTPLELGGENISAGSSQPLPENTEEATPPKGQPIPNRSEKPAERFRSEPEKPLSKSERSEPGIPTTGTPAANMPTPDIPEGLPKALTDLMREYQVGEWDIQAAVAQRGYYPSDTPIQNYDPDFIEGVLVGAWGQVYKIIQEIRSQEEIPFN